MYASFEVLYSMMCPLADVVKCKQEIQSEKKINDFFWMAPLDFLDKRHLEKLVLKVVNLGMQTEGN